MDGGGVVTKLRWTPQEDEVLLSTPSNKWAAARLGRSCNSCRNRRYFLHRHGAVTRHAQRDPADVRRIAFLLALAESCDASPSVALNTLALQGGGHWRDVLDEAAARRTAS